MFEAHQSITVVVAHRWEVLRQGLASILRQSWPDWHVVETGDCEAVISLASDKSVELLVIDRDLPGLGDPAGIARIRDADRTQRLVIVADLDHPEDVLQWLFAGANGYVSSGGQRLRIDRFNDIPVPHLRGDGACWRNLCAFEFGAVWPTRSPCTIATRIGHRWLLHRSAAGGVSTPPRGPLNEEHCPSP